MSNGLFDLTGKVVLAAGANSGIGLGFLQGCAKQGADAVVWGRRPDKNAEALDQGMEHYAAAKGALGAMMKGIAREMGQYQVRANVVAPGFILTGMVDENDPRTQAVRKHFAAITPLGRPGRPSDFEGIGAYLASDASSFHTGDILVVDGGRLVFSP